MPFAYEAISKDLHVVESTYYIKPRADYDIMINITTDVKDQSDGVFIECKRLEPGDYVTQMFIKLDKKLVTKKVLEDYIDTDVVTALFSGLVRKYFDHGNTVGLLFCMKEDSKKDVLSNIATQYLNVFISNIFRHSEEEKAAAPKHEFELCKTLDEVAPYSQLRGMFTMLDYSPSAKCLICVSTKDRRDKTKRLIKDKVSYSKKNTLYVSYGSIKAHNLEYLSTRYKEIVTQTKEKYDVTAFEEDMEENCQRLLYFAVLFDLFSTPAPFDATNISDQKLRDALFVMYNIARIKHLEKVFNDMHLEDVKDIDVTLLTSPHEWDLVCHLAMFPQVLSDFILLGIKEDKLQLHKLLQYLVSLAKLFSKYYRAVTILFDQSHLSSKTIARMALVKAVYNVFSFTLSKLFGVSLVSNM